MSFFGYGSKFVVGVPLPGRGGGTKKDDVTLPRTHTMIAAGRFELSTLGL